MVLLLAFFDEFTLFLKIVLWIAVPLIIVSFLVTTIFHYRQKKKNALKAAENPELPVDEVVDISLVSRLQKEVLHYKKRIKELQHALTFAKEVIPPESLKTRMSSLHNEVSALNMAPNMTPGSQADFQLSAAGANGAGHFSGDAVLENGSIAGNLADSDTGSASSAAYLHDLVNEQKTHVLFLQQQLETRIKAFHDLEFQFRENATLLEKMTMSYEHIKHQLDDGEAAASMHRIDKDSMQAQITRLENSLSELQDQHNKSLKILDQSPVNAIDRTNDALNAKPVISIASGTELSESGHSQI